MEGNRHYRMLAFQPVTVSRSNVRQALIPGRHRQLRTALFELPTAQYLQCALSTFSCRCHPPLGTAANVPKHSAWRRACRSPECGSSRLPGDSRATPTRACRGEESLRKADSRCASPTSVLLPLPLGGHGDEEHGNDHVKLQQAIWPCICMTTRPRRKNMVFSTSASSLYPHRNEHAEHCYRTPRYVRVIFRVSDSIF